jgi:putative SOS response-associated peptidase YedK
VPASGFYEWKKAGSSKEPYYIHTDSSLLAFAGLYDHWQKDGNEIYSYTIITTAANEMMSGLHERMPVILPPAHYEAWLNPESEGELLEPLLKPYEGKLAAYLVDKRVGRVSENDGGLLEPVG